MTSTAGGIGGAALASLLAGELSASEPSQHEAAGMPAGEDGRFAPRPPHFRPSATHCIFIYLYGGISQLDLFDPKPKLAELDGQPLPESLAANVRFAFVKKDTARFLASPRKFSRHGQCGMEISELLPHLAGCVDEIALVRSMHTEAFNHAPGELMTNTGTLASGHPSVGAWLSYGLGSESTDLPGYVVLILGERIKAYTWSNGFLPSVHQGVRLGSQGEPVHNLHRPAGMTPAIDRSQLDAIRDLNLLSYRHLGDPEIAARIAAYELAFRMQSAAPELIDLSAETAGTLNSYGTDRPDADAKTFATQCLLARRLVERGVRFVNLIHSNWDQHKDLDRDLARNCLVVDQPIAALLKDLKQRGLFDTTLVVVCTEFGRTPVSDNGQKPDMPNGRDHHPSAFSVWMAGGGVRGGQVIGQTDEFGWNVVEDPVHVNDFHATILHLFGLDHLKLTYRFKGRDFRLTDVGGKVVHKLLRSVS
ncbi:MAG: DUF1501 domain-containing protein [Pirellulales bacterium]